MIFKVAAQRTGLTLGRAASRRRSRALWPTFARLLRDLHKN
jgi:hypothetical protein